MKRRILDFVLILLFVWGCMMFGLWIIDNLIVPFSIPGVRRYIINTVQVIVSAAMVFLWLGIWRWLATSMFWRTIGNNQNK